MFAVLNVLGSMLMLFSVTYLLPIVTSLVYADGLLVDFIYAAIGCLAAGAGHRHRAVLPLRPEREGQGGHPEVDVRVRHQAGQVDPGEDHRGERPHLR